MKSSEYKRRADSLLLHTIKDKYLGVHRDDSAFALRYSEENIDEVVKLYYQMNLLIQRVEWLKGEEHIKNLVKFMRNHGISVEELEWATDMFAIKKQDVLSEIRKEIQKNES